MSVAPPQMEQPWSKGTDLRNDKGLYCWPHLVYDSAAREWFPSVTTILDLVPGDMKMAEFWFIAEYVDHVTTCAENRQKVLCYDKDAEMNLERSAREVLHDKHWIKFAGCREMTKRANRGTVGHDALEDWALNGQRVSEDDLRDYTFQLIQANDFALEVDYCIDYVRSIINWCDRHVLEVLWSEVPVFNRTYNYAGTSDIGLRLKDMFEQDGSPIPEEDTWGIDAKNSKGPKPTHPMQNAAYANAEFMGIKGTNTLIPFEKPTRFANLYVQPNGATLREWKREKKAFEAFLHLRMVWQYLEAGDLPVTVKAPKIKPPTKDQMEIPGVK